MPNWVSNTIRCTQQVANEILTRNEDGTYTFSFEKIIPSPKTEEECPSMFLINGCSSIMKEEDRPWFNWYQWNLANWGVKWDANYCYYHESEGEIVFETPWGAPMPIINKLCELYKEDISGSCEEEANMFDPFNWYGNKEGGVDIEEWEESDLSIYDRCMTICIDFREISDWLEDHEELKQDFINHCPDLKNTYADAIDGDVCAQDNCYETICDFIEEHDQAREDFVSWFGIRYLS